MGNSNIRMPRQVRFDGRSQVEGLLELEKQGLIKDFKRTTDRFHSAKSKFTFGLCPFFFDMPEGQINGDFSKYKIKVAYGANTAPRVFVTSHKLDKDCPHLYADGRLCLYKPDIFVWTNRHSIAKDIVPLVYAWLYFYEKWVETGKWLGPEAPH